MELGFRLKETLAKLFIILFSTSRLVFYSGATWNVEYSFYSMAPTVGVVDQSLLALSAVIGIWFSFLCFKDYLNKCPRAKIKVLLISTFLLLTVFCFWTIDFLANNSVTLLFVGNFTPLTLLFGGVLFAGYDDKLMYSIAQFSKYVAVVFLSLSLYYTVEFYVEFGYVGVRYGNSHIMTYFIYGFYALTLFVYGQKEFGYCRDNKLIIALSILAFFLAVASVSRGWIIQAIILLLYTYLGKELNGRRYHSKMISRLIIVLIIIGILVLAIIQFAPNIVLTIGERFDEDTRSLQLTEFLSQMDAGKFIFGQGYNATYMESAHGVYSYIDNQLLMMVFRYGLIPLTLYLLLIFKSIWGFIKYRIGYGFASLMWLAALNGLAIYLAFGIDIHNMLIMFVISRSLAIIDSDTQTKNSWKFQKAPKCKIDV